MIRAMAADDTREQAHFYDRNGRPLIAAVLHQCADEIERVHAGADRVLRAVSVWGALAEWRSRAVAMLGYACQVMHETEQAEAELERERAVRRRREALLRARHDKRLVLDRLTTLGSTDDFFGRLGWGRGLPIAGPKGPLP